MTEQQAAPNERTRRLTERRERMKALTPRVLRVRVEPTSDAFRKALRHPLTGMKFPETGSAEWPLDSFTKRRLKDGCIQGEGGKNLAEILAANRPDTLPTQPEIDNAPPAEQPGIDNTLPPEEEPPLGGKPPEPPLGGESRRVPRR